jgi:hypothetical protein
MRAPTIEEILPKVQEEFELLSYEEIKAAAHENPVVHTLVTVALPQVEDKITEVSGSSDKIVLQTMIWGCMIALAAIRDNERMEGLN